MLNRLHPSIIFSLLLSSTLLSSTLACDLTGSGPVTWSRFTWSSDQTKVKIVDVASNWPEAKVVPRIAGLLFTQYLGYDVEYVPAPGSCGKDRLSSPWSESADKFCSWQPDEFGPNLKRLTEYQTTYKNSFYNEIIIDSKHWREHLPECVEAVFGNRVHHEAFLKAFGLTEETHPFLALDVTNWEPPFGAGEDLKRSAGGNAFGG